MHYRVAQFDLEMPKAEELQNPSAVFSRFARQCASAATGLGAHRFGVFGWNGGTQVALRCAIDYPERVASCLLLGPFCRLPDMRAIDLGVEFMRVMMEQPDRRLYAHYWFMGGLSPGFVAEHFEDVEHWAGARAAGDRFLAGSTERAMAWACALRGHVDHRRGARGDPDADDSGRPRTRPLACRSHRSNGAIVARSHSELDSHGAEGSGQPRAARGSGLFPG